MCTSCSSCNALTPASDPPFCARSAAEAAAAAAKAEGDKARAAAAAAKAAEAAAKAEAAEAKAAAEAARAAASKATREASELRTELAQRDAALETLARMNKRLEGQVGIRGRCCCGLTGGRPASWRAACSSVRARPPPLRARRSPSATRGWPATARSPASFLATATCGWRAMLQRRVSQNRVAGRLLPCSTLGRPGRPLLPTAPAPCLRRLLASPLSPMQVQTKLDKCEESLVSGGAAAAAGASAFPRALERRVHAHQHGCLPRITHRLSFPLPPPQHNNRRALWTGPPSMARRTTRHCCGRG